MADSYFELGKASKISAASEGIPGHRHFYLLIESEAGLARLWLEKEQLFQMALGIQRLLSSATFDELDEQTDLKKIEFNPQLDLDFVIDKLALGRQGREKSFVLTASELVSNEDESEQSEEGVNIEVRLNKNQLNFLSNQALEVCAAGRPLCPLCGVPVGNERHICARTNGHVKL